jgi:hypothetical protein
MFCAKCGNKLGENINFCGKCGTERQPAPEVPEVTEAVNDQNIFGNANMNSAYITVNPVIPGRTPKKRFPRFVAPVAVIAIVAVVAVTLFLSLPNLLMPSNPVAVTLQSVMNISELSSFDYRITVGVENEGEVSVRGYMHLGRDLYNSIFELETEESSSYSSSHARFVFSGGAAGVYSRNSSSWDNWREYEHYEYADRDTIRRGFFEVLQSMGIRMDERDIDINRFVRNGKFDIDYMEKIGQQISRDSQDYLQHGLGLDSSVTQYLRNMDKLEEEINKMFTNFLRECEKDEFLDMFVTNLETSKSGGSTTYDFDIRVFRFINAFVDYCIDSLSSGSRYPELHRVLSSIARDEMGTTLNEMLREISRELRNELDSMSRNFSDRIRMSVTVSRSRILERMNINFTVGSQNVSVRINIDNHNSVRPDTSGVRDFMNRAESGARSSQW